MSGEPFETPADEDEGLGAEGGLQDLPCPNCARPVPQGALECPACGSPVAPGGG
jgi:hypothetical protein